MMENSYPDIGNMEFLKMVNFTAIGKMEFSKTDCLKEDGLVE